MPLAADVRDATAHEERKEIPMGEMQSGQLKAERVRVMGTALGTLFHELWSHVVELHAELQEYRKLYGSAEARAVLDDAAGQFFRTVQKVLWEHVLLYVARLTDNPSTSGHQNLSILRLPGVIADPGLKQRVAALIDRASPDWAPVRTLRNQWLAHLDLAVGTDDPDAVPLPDMRVEDVERALSSMGEVLSAIEERHFGPADRRYFPLRPLGDADHLLFWLRRALKVDAERRARMLSGCALPEDLGS